MKHLFLIPFILVCCSSKEAEKPQSTTPTTTNACHILVIRNNISADYSQCLQVEDMNDCGCHDYYCKARTENERIEIARQTGMGTVIFRFVKDQKCPSTK